MISVAVLWVCGKLLSFPHTHSSWGVDNSHIVHNLHAAIGGLYRQIFFEEVLDFFAFLQREAPAAESF